MKLKFRIDIINPRHTHFTVFQNGGNCGSLCMENKAFDVFTTNLHASDIEFETIYNNQSQKDHLICQGRQT